MFKGFRGLLAGAAGVVALFGLLAVAAGPAKTPALVDATASSPQGPAAVLFEEAQFGGRAMVLQARNPDLKPAKSGKAGSIQVRDGAWRLCEKPQFLGRCVVVNGDHPDLAWNGELHGVASAQRIE